MADSRTRHCHETLEQDADGIGKKMYELYDFRSCMGKLVSW